MKKLLSLLICLLSFAFCAAANGEADNDDAYRAMQELFEGRCDYVYRIPAIADFDLDGAPELLAAELFMHDLWNMDVWEWNGNALEFVGQYYVPWGEMRLTESEDGPVWLRFSEEAEGGYQIFKTEVMQLLSNGEMQAMELLRKEGQGDVPNPKYRYYFNQREVDGTSYETMKKKLEALPALHSITLDVNYSEVDWKRIAADYDSSCGWHSSADCDWMEHDENECEQQDESVLYSNEVWALALKKLATRSGPSTLYEDMGTYNVKGEWLRVRAKAWDERNEIWWVLVDIPYRNEIRTLWTGYKRFDVSTLPLEIIPVF